MAGFTQNPGTNLAGQFGGNIASVPFHHGSGWNLNNFGPDIPLYSRTTAGCLALPMLYVNDGNRDQVHPTEI